MHCNYSSTYPHWFQKNIKQMDVFIVDKIYKVYMDATTTRRCDLAENLFFILLTLVFLAIGHRICNDILKSMVAYRYSQVHIFSLIFKSFCTCVITNHTLDYIHVTGLMKHLEYETEANPICNLKTAGLWRYQRIPRG